MKCMILKYEAKHAKVASKLAYFLKERRLLSDDSLLEETCKLETIMVADDRRLPRQAG